MSNSSSAPQDSAARVASDIKNLEKRLAALIDQDTTKSSRVSFGFVVLSCVAHGNYERAYAELESAGVGLEEYALFQTRSERFIEHAKGLVAAIKTKHSIGRSPHVNKSKQKELADKIAEHFLDLKKTLIVVEKIQKSVRAEDLSSTTYFFRSCFFAVVAVFVFFAVRQYISSPEFFNFSDISQFFTWAWPE